MGWFNAVADLLEQRGHFRLAAHDGVRLREADRLEAENVLLREALRASTEELQAALESGENIARLDIKKQIAANEATLGGK